MNSDATTVTFLGTAAVVPGGGHDTASFVINGRYLVDTGWYAAIKMQEYGLSPLELDALILTHCHHDHYLGLPHLLFYRAMSRSRKPELPPLKIIGPAGETERVVDLARRFLQATRRFPEAAADAEVIPLAPGTPYEDDRMYLATCVSSHPVPGLCYRMTDKQTGATLAFTGDTAYYPHLAEHLQGASLLITEASYGENPAPVENRSLHMGAPDAARLAVEAGVRQLALVHCPEERQAAALEGARAIFPNTFWPVDGETVSVGG